MKAVVATVLVACGWAAPVSAADVPHASATLVNYLVDLMEKREQPLSAPPLGAPLSLPASFAAEDAERQLNALGPRAAAAVPRIADLYAARQSNLYELAWTLWYITPQPADDALPSLADAHANATGGARYAVLAQIGHSRAAPGLAVVTVAGQAADVHERLLATVALGFSRGNDNVMVPLLASLLKDESKDVRTAAANSLRLLGPRSSPATPALIDYLLTRDNLYIASSALATASVQALRAVQPDIEAILIDPKLSFIQKQPVVPLLMRIELESAAASSSPSSTRSARMPQVPEPAASVSIQRPQAPGFRALTSAEASTIRACLPEAYAAFPNGLTEIPGGMWAFPDLWKAPRASLAACGAAHGLTAERATLLAGCDDDAVLGATAKAMRAAGVTRQQMGIKILSLPLGYRAVVDRAYASSSRPEEVLLSEWDQCVRPFVRDQ